VRSMPAVMPGSIVPEGATRHQGFILLAPAHPFIYAPAPAS
jgi:hypothetical protein